MVLHEAFYAAKTNIFRNAPYSTRLSTDQFDLEWSCPRRGGTVLLLDDDRPQIKGLKKLNTVAYYHLPNNALLTMQSRCGTVNGKHHSHRHHQPPGNQSFTFRSGSSDTTCSMWSSAQLIETASSGKNIPKTLEKYSKMLSKQSSVLRKTAFA